MTSYQVCCTGPGVHLKLNYVTLSCISMQKILCETGFIWYIETLLSSLFFGIRERQYQDLPTFSGYVGLLLWIVLGLSFPSSGFPRLWGLAVCKNSALSLVECYL